MNRRPITRAHARLWWLLLLGPAVGGCGGDGGGAPPSGSIRTLAYVITDCHETAAGESPIGMQRLLVQRGDDAPIPIAEFPILGPPAPFGTCAALGLDRLGPESVAAGVFQRLAVSPDATTVIFEVTDDLALCNDEICVRPPPLPPASRGIFRVAADGTELRRLAPPSRVPTFFEGANVTLILPSLAISANGQLATLTDLGPGPDAIERTQIFTLGLDSGAERQITSLPDAPLTDPDFPATCCPGFFDNRTATFASTADPDGTNPTNQLSFFSVGTDGSDLMRFTSTVVLPDAEISPIFTIREGVPSVTVFILPEDAQEGPPGRITEVLLIDGENALQLTNFGRTDTGNPILSNDGLQVFFVASADPLGTNPTQNCQVFSIDPTGANLRQLTQFGEVEHSIAGCEFGEIGLGCAIMINAQDPVTGTLLLYSSCDPLGTNPNGGQLFTMRPDGTDLRQLTDARGLVIEPGNVSSELPGPFAYSAFEQ